MRVFIAGRGYGPRRSLGASVRWRSRQTRSSYSGSSNTWYQLRPSKHSGFVYSIGKSDSSDLAGRDEREEARTGGVDELRRTPHRSCEVGPVGLGDAALGVQHLERGLAGLGLAGAHDLLEARTGLRRVDDLPTPDRAATRRSCRIGTVSLEIRVVGESVSIGIVSSTNGSSEKGSSRNGSSMSKSRAEEVLEERIDRRRYCLDDGVELGSVERPARASNWSKYVPIGLTYHDPSVSHEGHARLVVVGERLGEHVDQVAHRDPPTTCRRTRSNSSPESCSSRSQELNSSSPSARDRHASVGILERRTQCRRPNLRRPAGRSRRDDATRRR